MIKSIVGIYHFNGAPVSQKKLVGMAEALFSSERSQLVSAQSNSPCIRLGEIISEKNQGVYETDSNCVLVSDARIDNRTELGRALNIPASEYETVPDSVIILKAYQKWGKDCCKHLIGDFVFLLWDGHQLFCACDPLGMRVLYYHQTPHFLAIASAPKALLALPEVPRQINETTLADFLVLQGDPTSTFYKNIVRLPPAHTLTATDKGITLRQYWSLDPTKRIIFKSDDDYVEAFRELFEEAVRCRLRSEHPIGAFLSGGLDSPSVACTAARQLKAKGQRLTTFTSVPREGFDAPERSGWLNDETPYIEALKPWHDNLEVTYLRPEGRTMLDNIDRLFELAEGPMRNPCNRIWMEAVLEAAAARGIRVMLTGQNGNNSISYNGSSLFTELARTGHWLTLMREIKTKAAMKKISPLAVFKGDVLRPFLPNALWAWHSRRKEGAEFPWAKHSAINPDFAKAMAVDERARELGFDHHYRPLTDGRKWRIRWGTGSGAMHYGRDLSNGWRHHFGIEMRDPTADIRILEFCLAIPENQYLRKGKDRYLIRRAMDGVLPPEVLWKTKRGEQLPDWYERLIAVRGEIAAEIDRLENLDLARRCLDLPRMRHLVENWPQNWHDPKIVREYRLLLQRGIMVGRFIRWFEASV
ncbi:MAG: asparagine synthase-related protein [Pseudomonadota bacterium]